MATRTKEPARKTAPPRQPAAAAAKEQPAFPARLDPVLVVPAKTLPPGRWRFEPKRDGYRLQARIDERGAVAIFNRRGEDWTARLPTIATALKKLPRQSWFDGVLVFEDEATGADDFLALTTGGMRDAPKRLVYRIFDAPFLDGDDLRLVALDRRKDRLHTLLQQAHGKPVQCLPTWVGHEDELLQRACKCGLEGLIAKERDSAYFGIRAGTWVKRACTQQASFLVLGLAPKPKGAGIAAVHVGHRSEGGILIYEGIVAEGLTDAALAQLEASVKKHPAKEPELFLATGRKVDAKKVAGGVWTVPALVIEASFTRRVAGLVRQARLKGFREDVAVEELVR